MRIFLFIVALLLVVPVVQADWEDNGDGTSTRAITMSTALTETADPILDVVEVDGVGTWVDWGDGSWKVAASQTAPTTQVKDILEQLRAWDNYRFRYAEDELNVGDWLAALLPGFENTQGGGEIIYTWYGKFWKAFVRHWVAASSTDLTGDGLAVSVPAPPNQP